MSKKALALIALITVSLLWSTAGVTAKTLVKDVPPLVAGFYRFFLASLLILPFYLFKKSGNFAWKKLLLPTCLGALNVPCYFLGIKATSANAAVLIFTSSPLLTAILSYFLIKEKNSPSKWLGVFLGLIGVLIIILLPALETGQKLSGDLRGNLFIAGGMLSWTIYAIWSRRIQSHHQSSPLTSTSLYLFTSSLGVFLLALITRQPLFPPQLFQPAWIATLAYAAIFLSVVTYFLFQWAVKYVGATTASFRQYLETLFAIPLNFLFLGEKLTLGLIFGGGLVLIGVLIATVGELHRRRRRDSNSRGLAPACFPST